MTPVIPIDDPELFGKGIDHFPFLPVGQFPVEFPPEVVEFAPLVAGGKVRVARRVGGRPAVEIVGEVGVGRVQGVVVAQDGRRKGLADAGRQGAGARLVGELGDAAELGLFEFGVVLADLALDAHIDGAVVEEVRDPVEDLGEELVKRVGIEAFATEGGERSGQNLSGRGTFVV